MKHLLDTDICIYWLKGVDEIKKGVKRTGEDNLAISIITLGELKYGAYYSKHVKQNLQKLADFLRKVELVYLDEKSIDQYGNIKADLRRKGRLIEDFDLLNASIALSKDWTFVTNNLRHYERIEGLKIENWMEDGGLR